MAALSVSIFYYIVCESRRGSSSRIMKSMPRVSKSPNGSEDSIKRTEGTASSVRRLEEADEPRDCSRDIRFVESWYTARCLDAAGNTWMCDVSKAAGRREIEADQDVRAKEIADGWKQMHQTIGRHTGYCMQTRRVKSLRSQSWRSLLIMIADAALDRKLCVCSRTCRNESSLSQ